MTTDQGTILITGGCGFIGSALIRHLIRETGVEVVNLDKLTYSASPAAVAECAPDSRYRLIKGCITDAELVSSILREFSPHGIIHLAAESHVDRSIHAPSNFIDTNIVGSFVLLSEARNHWLTLDDEGKRAFRFHHVSTDEVFGSLSETSSASVETSAYQPRSPYSASKAASDHLVQAWHATYGLPVVITTSSNNYGPWQFPEKLVPVVISAALDGRAIPVYGDGRNIRDWLHVEDHVRAIWSVFNQGKTGSQYNVSGDSEVRNLDVVNSICGILDELRPRSGGGNYNEQIAFVTDRPGHDWRYALDCTKLKSETDWAPQVTFEEGLRTTVQWYLENESWWRAIAGNRFDHDGELQQ